MTAIGSFLNIFGTELTDSSASIPLTGEQVSPGLLLNVGRNGTQTISLPSTNIIGSPSIFIIASDSNVSALNTVTISYNSTTAVLDYVDSFAAFQWLSSKSRWVRL
jgi:hypothetical protein